MSERDTLWGVEGGRSPKGADVYRVMRTFPVLPEKRCKPSCPRAQASHCLVLGRDFPVGRVSQCCLLQRPCTCFRSSQSWPCTRRDMCLLDHWLSPVWEFHSPCPLSLAPYENNTSPTARKIEHTLWNPKVSGKCMGLDQMTSRGPFQFYDSTFPRASPQCPSSWANLDHWSPSAPCLSKS